MSKKVAKEEDICDNRQITEFEEPDGEATCSIIFENNPKRVYYTGQVVNGCVHLAINKTTTVRAIYAKVTGRCYCKFSTGGGKHTRTHIKEEMYFNQKIYYVGSPNSTSGHTTVESAEYKYSFDCNLPDGCPTSVEECDGFVRYSVTVVIEEDVDKTKEFVESFTVINPLNLNDDESNSYPMTDDTEFTFTKYCCCLCCWITEPVKFSAKVPMKGYAPGQGIEITITVDNKSNQTYEQFTGNIFKKVEFYANDRTISSTEKLATFNCEGCVPGDQLSRLLIVTVPSTARTEKTDICSISYELTVEAFSECCNEDLKFEFPLVIGTYPIQAGSTLTGGALVVTQQPSKLLSNGERLEGTKSEKSVFEQPLLNEMSSDSVATASHGKQKIDGTLQPDFRIGESTRSDKDLAETYRPMYPVYTSNRQVPATCDVKVELIEMKSLKM